MSDDKYNGFAIGDQALTEDGWLVEVVDLTMIQTDAPFVLIPHMAPRVVIKSLGDHGSVGTGDIGHIDPGELTPVKRKTPPHFTDAAQLAAWRQERG